MRAHLRWVPSSDFGIKIKAVTKLGLSVTVSVNNLEIDFPVWIQAHLQVRSSILRRTLDCLCAMFSRGLLVIIQDQTNGAHEG